MWENFKLKTPENVFLGDVLNDIYYGDIADQEKFEKHYYQILKIHIGDFVDQDIRSQFEVSRNSFLYGYFYAPLLTVAVTQAASTAEWALRRYLGNPDKGREFNSLNSYLSNAAGKRQKILDVKSILNEDMNAKEFAEKVSDYRNKPAHGSPIVLQPNVSFERIKVFSLIINQLYMAVVKRDLKSQWNYFY